MDSEERHPIKSWARRLSGESEPLTLQEAHALAAIAQTDRSLEMLTVLQDIQARLTRLEIFVANMVPEYDDYARRELHQALTNGQTTPPGR